MADPAAAASVDGAPRRRPTLPSLTGLRFLAALLVFLNHSSLPLDPLRPTAPVSFFADHDVVKALFNALGRGGPIGVSFFFVLSGFVLTWSSTPNDRVTGFWRRRMLKIYPNHIVIWALGLWLFASTVPVHTWLTNLLLVHTYSDRPADVQGLYPDLLGWTLCAEMLFYALFPFFIVLIRRIERRRLWAWALVMLAAVVGVEVVTPFIPGGLDTGHGITIRQYWFGYLFPPARLPEFLLGMVLARIVAAGLWPRIGLLSSGVLFVAGFWIADVVPPPYYFSTATIVPIAMVICAAASSDLRASDAGASGGAGDCAGTRGAGWLRSRTMVWLGDVSFAFYMVQGLVVLYGRPKVFGSRTYAFIPAVGMTIVLFLANLLAAWLLYRLVERPVMRRFARGGWKRPVRSVPLSPVSVSTAESR